MKKPVCQWQSEKKGKNVDQVKVVLCQGAHYMGRYYDYRQCNGTVKQFCIAKSFLGTSIYKPDSVKEINELKLVKESRLFTV